MVWRLDRELSGVIHSANGGGSPAAAHSSVTVLPAVTETGLDGVTMMLGSPIVGNESGVDNRQL